MLSCAAAPPPPGPRRRAGNQPAAEPRPVRQLRGAAPGDQGARAGSVSACCPAAAVRFSAACKCPAVHATADSCNPAQPHSSTPPGRPPPPPAARPSWPRWRPRWRPWPSTSTPPTWSRPASSTRAKCTATPSSSARRVLWGDADSGLQEGGAARLAGWLADQPPSLARSPPAPPPPRPRRCPSPRRQLVREAEQRPAALTALMRDQFGNYVVQRCLDVATRPQRRALLAAIQVGWGRCSKAVSGRAVQGFGSPDGCETALLRAYLCAAAQPGPAAQVHLRQAHCEQGEERAEQRNNGGSRSLSVPSSRFSSAAMLSGADASPPPWPHPTG